jgi:hypothetical protein
MGTFQSGVLLGIVAVLLLDTIGSILSNRLRFRYTKLTPVSLLLWAASAAIASRGAAPDLIKSVGLGWMAGLIVGLADSTAGWWISWRLGPGRLRPELISRRNVLRIIFRVTMLAAALGGAGALVRELANKLIAHSPA